MNILLVDDDVVDRKMIRRSLVKGGIEHHLTEVSTVEEGIFALEELCFDLLLLDYNMPSKNGVDLLIELKRINHIKDLTIVMISNSHSEELVLKCLDLGVQDFLLKEEVTASLLSRSIIQAKKRFELESQLHKSYLQVKQMAERDSLTGLYNRYYFEETCQRLMQADKKRYKCAGILVVDIVDFKKINDRFGHEIADQLLLELGASFNRHTKQEDIVSRFGGDEFACLMVSCDNPLQIKIEAEKLVRLLSRSYSIYELDIYCQVRMGISLYPLNGNNADDLIRFADIALFRAKSSQSAMACIFEDNMQTEFQMKYNVEQDLRGAIERQELELAFQPIVDIQQAKVVSLEALIRWPTAKYTSSPQEFITIAEESKLIEPLGKWIIEHAITTLKQIQTKCGYPIRLAINLSPLQLGDISLPAFINDCLKRVDIDGTLFTFELTETALLDESERVTSSLSRIKELGCKIALDDFGTGYSSISHLLNYPIDIVKVDKSLTDRIEVDDRGKRIFMGLIDMLKSLQLSIVVEGVENYQQYYVCKEARVDKIQGYYFSSPVSEKSVVKTIKAVNRELAREFKATQ
ncbi:EAL domain-containing response regulator [Pseudoalteromonas sp. Of11M-6]|uniref:two-component system response regulator n=1 Tax=Pseudoalteromonas sp. Of11M-6 TaxID=2917754 RepID=UPI001EF6DA4A|nr:EAL domain-containing response regulator [Pseudoalteromonas sp. Of11M-6]MCG7554856.1 EAL domain-containing protein [Pseudoalteromonas sp. Of11M-6]